MVKSAGMAVKIDIAQILLPLFIVLNNNRATR
jgi:hypothetical protein